MLEVSVCHLSWSSRVGKPYCVNGKMKIKVQRSNAYTRISVPAKFVQNRQRKSEYIIEINFVHISYKLALWPFTSPALYPTIRIR